MIACNLDGELAGFLRVSPILLVEASKRTLDQIETEREKRALRWWAEYTRRKTMSWRRIWRWFGYKRPTFDLPNLPNKKFSAIVTTYLGGDFSNGADFLNACDYRPATFMLAKMYLSIKDHLLANPDDYVLIPVEAAVVLDLNNPIFSQKR